MNSLLQDAMDLLQLTRTKMLCMTHQVWYKVNQHSWCHHQFCKCCVKYLNGSYLPSLVSPHERILCTYRLVDFKVVNEKSGLICDKHKSLQKWSPMVVGPFEKLNSILWTLLGRSLYFRNLLGCFPVSLFLQGRHFFRFTIRTALKPGNMLHVEVRYHLDTYPEGMIERDAIVPFVN